MATEQNKKADFSNTALSINDLLLRKADELHLIILFIIAILATGFTLLDYLESNFRELWLDFLILPVIFISFIIHRFGYKLISKLISIVSMTMIISIFSLITCQETAVLTFFIPIFIGVLILFQGSEKKWGYFFIVIIMLLLIFLLTTDFEPWGPNPASQKTIVTEWTINTLGASILSILEIIFILKINNSFQAELIDQSNKLSETNHILQATVKSREKMMSMLSHDLRSPLLALLASIEILSNKKESPEIKEMLLSELKKRVSQTIAFMDNMLSWARNQSESIKAHKEDVPLLEINEFLANYCNILNNEKVVNFIIDTPVEGKMKVDKNLLQAVLRNLISNAYKFTKEGGKIVVTITSSDNFYKFSVEDNGKGIKSENIQKLLNSESFTTLGTAREKGHGFGIQLVNDFIKAMGSELQIISEENKGSQFYFFIKQQEAK